MAEKTIDLTPKADKITDEQLQELQSLLNEINKNQLSIGQLETQKAGIIEGVGQLRLKLREIKTAPASVDGFGRIKATHARDCSHPWSTD